jgi:hypothetical protein
MFLILLVYDQGYAIAFVAIPISKTPNIPFGLGFFGYPYYKDNGHPNKDKPMQEVA